MIQGKKIITIMTTYNEEGRAYKVVEKIPLDLIDEILVVNDGSTDKTKEEIQKTNKATILEHKERKGIGIAVRDGLKYAKEKNYDIIVIVAGNDKDDPSQIPTLLKPILEEGFDYVQGSRYIAGGKKGKMPLHRILFTKLYSRAVSLLTGHKMTDATNGFRVYKKSILDDLRINLYQNWLIESLEYYLSVKVLLLGYKVKEVPVTKIYPQNVKYYQYTKIKPFSGWLKRIKPLFFLTLGIKK